jgi:DNA-binding beta-propeller fold protein YncE
MSSFRHLLLFILAGLVCCSEAGLLYLTEHSTSNLHAYDSVSGELMLKVAADKELRGMVPYGSTLLIAQAPSDQGYIWNITMCDLQGLPGLEISNEALSHPYGLSLFEGHVLLASNQDSTAIFSYNLTSGQEIANGFPPISGMRGISVDENGLVYVASKDANSVLVFKGISGASVGSIPVQDPIGVFARSGSLLYVTQGGDAGNVLAFNRSLATFAPVWTSVRTVGHGAGIALDPSTGSLFVNEQDTYSVLVFDADSGAFRNTLLSGLTNVPEQLLFANC